MKSTNYVGSAQTAGPATSKSKAMPVLSRDENHLTNGSKMLKPSAAWQIIMFSTLTLSIVASRFIDYYRAAIPWSPFRDWQYLLFALIVSLMAFPIVYRKAQQSRSDPVLVQLGVIFAAGIGWEKMLSTTAGLLKP
jgi:hypothetical protein